MFSLERTLLWIVRIGFFLLLLTPLIVSKSLFFPFITGKNFYFRIIVELMFGVWVALAILNNQFRPRKSLVMLALSSFVGVLVLATVFGVDPYHSFWSNFERMEGLITHLHVFALFMVLAHSIRRQKEWFWFLIVSLIVSLIAAIDGLLQSTGTVEILGGGRPFARFGNSIYLAVYLMFHLFFLAVIFVRQRVTWIRSLCAALFLFELYVFFQAASRGAFVGFSGGVAIAALLFIFFSQSRSYRIAGFLAFLVVGIVTGFVLFAPQSTLIQKSELLQRLSSISLEGISKDPRVMIWGIALNAAKARPLLGWGPENFIIPYAKFYNPNLFGNEPWFDRAHNMLLEWLVAAGVIGLVAYFAIFLCAVLVMKKLAGAGTFSRSEVIIVIALVSAYIIQNVFVFDNVVTYILVTALLAYLHALYISSVPLKHSQKMSISSSMLAAGVVIGSIVLAFTLNLRQIQAATKIITSLQLLSSGDADRIIEEFESTIELNTFGTSEARERVADTVVQVAVSGGQTNAEFDKLLDFGIRELEKEFAESPSPRTPLFLGKLYTVRANLTGNDVDKAEAVYQTLEKRAPHYVQTYLGLAELYLIAGQNEKAIAVAEEAYRLPTKRETLGALFFPVFSVDLIAGSFDQARDLILSYKERFSSNPPIFGKEEMELIVQRSRRGGALESRLRLFEELNRLFFEVYKYPQPFLLQETMDIYRSLGNDARARELLALYVTPETKERARMDAQAERNPRTEAFINRFLQALDSLR